MARYSRSEQLGTPLSTVWQSVGDVLKWPSLFEELVRVQPGGETADGIMMTCTDVHARSFNLRVTVEKDHQARTITADVDPTSDHPRGFRSVRFTVAPEGELTRLTLTADYARPLPIVGALFAKARRRGDAETYLNKAFDSAVRVANEQVFNYQDTVQTILSRKGQTVISALPEDSVESLCQLINTHRIGAVLIREVDGTLVGLVSERDIVYRLARSGADTLKLCAADIMTRDLIVCDPQRDLLFVMACLTDNKIRHLPVMDQNELVGVISIVDVVQQRMHALEAESDTLRNYIAAREWRFHSPQGLPASEPTSVKADEMRS